MDLWLTALRWPDLLFTASVLCPKFSCMVTSKGQKSFGKFNKYL